ncbi:MAG: hypothetical protein BWY63_00748 [Chloroflexi bacterium ADurb.Bin360]|nr:MAG: hypothetical protein BWY63_00748 [Chloroflexi bacterium ADurb.Bin360]
MPDPAIDPRELINFGTGPNQKPITTWDLIRFGYGLYHLEHLPEDAQLTSDAENAPGVIEFVEVIPKILARFEFDRSDQKVHTEIAKLLIDMQYHLNQEGVCCLDGRQAQLNYQISALIHSLRSEEGQRPILMMMADTSFRDLLIKTDYYPYLPAQLHLLLQRAEESWQAGFYHGAVIFTLLATERVFGYFYEHLQNKKPLERDTWGTQLDDLHDAHPEIPELLIWNIHDVITHYRNPILHGTILDAETGRVEATRDAEETVEALQSGTPYDLEETCPIEPLTAHSARCIWKRCSTIVQEMLHYLETKGLAFCPTGQDDIDEFLEFVDFSVHHTHRSAKESAYRLPKSIFEDAAEVEGLAGWEKDRKSVFPRLVLLSDEQIDAYVNWCIHRGQLLEVSSCSRRNGKRIDVISLNRKSEERLQKIWCERAYNWLSSWSNDVPEPDWWGDFHDLSPSIKEQILGRIRQQREIRSFHDVLLFWRQYEVDHCAGHAGWKHVVAVINRLIEAGTPS